MCLTSCLRLAGDIIFRAWQTCAHVQRVILEEEGIQVLMKSAILATSPQLCANILRVLRGLHEQKRIRGVDEMLHRLYEPILWRHLKAANSAVRKNALNLMLDAFPIQVWTHMCAFPSCIC
jgi:condensin-2 complex subunit G2